MRLASRRRDVLEVGVIVEDHRTVMFRDGGSQQVDYPGCAAMTTGGHADLDIPGTISDHLTDRQDDVEFFAAPGNRLNVGQIAACHGRRKRCDESPEALARTLGWVARL